jgi:hypothetical protein
MALAQQYGAQGLNMLTQQAQFVDGLVSVEAGLTDKLIRMEIGKFKVFAPLLDWFEEFRLFHRKHEKVVKEGDDLLAAYGGDDAALCLADLPEGPAAAPADGPGGAAGWETDC